MPQYPDLNNEVRLLIQGEREDKRDDATVVELSWQLIKGSLAMASSRGRTMYNPSTGGRS